MPFAPFVLVTATTELIREVPRVRVNEAYTNAVASFGLIPVVLPPIDPALAVASLTGVGGLMLTGGEDVDPRHFGDTPHPANGAPHHARDAYELALARAAYEQRVPTLAVCRGAQVMNIALGGSLVQDIPAELPNALDHAPAGRRGDRVHDVILEPGSRLARTLGAIRISTNSSHHQAIGRVADALRVSARTTDGVIEGAESVDPAWWMLAVQWHPEELTATTDDWDRRLFAAFADAIRADTRSST